MTATRIIPASDDADFPYEAARRELLSLGEVVIEEIDFPAMISTGKRFGWPDKLVEEHWQMMARGRCFAFRQVEEPQLSGRMYEDNIFFSYSSSQHEAACRPVIMDLASRLRLRTMDQ